MNSIILNKLPQCTKNGLRLRTDFRESIKFELLMQDRDIDNKDKLELALNLYFYKIPDNIEKAIEDILWFYKCGKEELANSNNKGNNKNKKNQIYSYEFDDNYIYSAFLQQYNVDLQDIEYLHWWKFKAMFEGLSKDAKIVEIMGYRAIDLRKIKDKEEKERYKKLKDIYRLPDMRTQEEKEAEFARSFL